MVMSRSLMHGLALVGLLACNRAPVDYRDLGQAPGRDGDWGGPSDAGCDSRRVRGPDDVIIDGYRLCSRDVMVRPVDDPVLRACDDPATADLAPDEEVVWVYDGEIAKAYRLAAMYRREGIHDELRGIPVFVDF